MANTPWTKARIDLLEELCATRLNYREIAARLGGGITKNAAIGKAAREGFAQPISKKECAARLRPAKRKPRFAAPRQTRGSSVLSALFATDGYVPPAEEVVIPVGERKGVADLDPDDCRFPVGDPQHADFHFCAKPKVPGLPYCETHARRCYMPPTAARHTVVPFPVNSNAKRESEDA